MYLLLLLPAFCLHNRHQKTDLKTKMFTINAWNEWTEGSYLEPDDRYGDSKLKAIKKVFIDENL